MSLVPSKQIHKTDSKTISEQARENVRQKTAPSDIVKIENEAKDNIIIYKAGDRVSFNYYGRKGLFCQRQSYPDHKIKRRA